MFFFNFSKTLSLLLCCRKLTSCQAAVIQSTLGQMLALVHQICSKFENTAVVHVEKDTTNVVLS